MRRMAEEQEKQPVDWVLGFNWLVDPPATKALLQNVQQAVDMGARSITLSLSSLGGATDQASYAHEVLVAIGTQVELITHNVGTIQSAAMMLFLAGSRRYSVPHGTFLVHGTLHNTGGSVGVEHVTYGAESIKADDERAATVMASRTGRDSKLVRSWYKGQKLRDTAFALEQGIIHEVAPLRFSPSSRFHQIVF
jgi:ATP-dependent Clp protease, protease subunit